MQRCFTSILSADVASTARFYVDLFGMHRHFDSDWFVILKHANIESLELGILERGNDIVPATDRGEPAGVLLTFVVDDVDAVFARAQSLELSIVEAPTDMPYGQRRLLLRDPEGTLVDVSSPIAAR